MNNVIKIGLILGITGTASSLIMSHLIGPNVFFSGKSVLISLAVNLFLMIFLGIRYLRNEENSYLSYGEALKSLFIASMIGASISLIVTTAMYQNNKEMMASFDQYVIESQKAGLKMGMKLTGASEEKIQAELDNLQDKIDNGEIPATKYPFSFSNLPLNFLNQIIFSLIMALLAAIFVKKKGNEYA